MDEAKLGPAVIDLTSIAILFAWGRWKLLKNSPVPSALVIVVFGVAANLLFRALGGDWAIGLKQLVDVPIADSFAQFLGFFRLPNFG